MGAYKYTAFISYSHQDDVFAKRLHRQLEAYKVPSHLVDTVGQHGTVPSNLKPIFRDQDELSVDGSLSQTIQVALTDSASLIVLCSPASVASHWVNEEIMSFKRLARERGETPRIYPVLVSGEPFASRLPGREGEECLPKALRFALGSDGELSDQPEEPLAADMRGNAAERRQGKSKLQAALLGVGLDEIIQRDLQRQRRSMTAITVGAAIAVLTMGTLTGFAVDARKDADARRGDAEGLIEFMLTDLKDKLEPVGRLDALEAVADKASTYYDGYAASDHDDDSLGRRARTYHFLGEIAYSQGQTQEAIDYYNKAYASTEALLARSPNDPDRVFEHAKSAVARATPIYFEGKFDEARPLIQDYIDFSERLLKMEPKSKRALENASAAYENMAILNHKQSQFEAAEALFKTGETYVDRLVAAFPDDQTAIGQKGNNLAWQADNYLFLKESDKAREYRREELAIYRSMLDQDPANRQAQRALANSYLGLAKIEKQSGNVEAAAESLRKAVNLCDELRLYDPTNWLSLWRYVDALRQEIDFQIRHGLYAQAREGLNSAKAAIAQSQTMSDTKTSYELWEEEYIIYLSTILYLMEGEPPLALNEADELLTTRGYTTTDTNLTQGIPILLLTVKHFVLKNVDELETISGRYKDSDKKDSLRHMRVAAMRDLLRGKPKAFDAYIEQEQDATIKLALTVLRKTTEPIASERAK
ncbi:TIR domain-containing protein [Litorimonas sp. RW-G-Af-16]|uniref:TIR domain-containing protein n=1 Tax=Litorimonas sp. RW-G-Af-16 TaxID=3241168 RepID=UPI00390C9D0A